MKTDTPEEIAVAARLYHETMAAIEERRAYSERIRENYPEAARGNDQALDQIEHQIQSMAKWVGIKD